MAYASITIKDLVERSVHHNWSIPEFQRGFVWKTTQVRDLVESLWLGYPVGTLLIWESRSQVEQRGPSDASRPTQWVVDGQQRTTALCILSGRKPYWWGAQAAWEKTISKFDIRFDIHAKEPPYFVVANAATRKTRGSRYLPVRDILTLDTSREHDQRKLQEIAKKVKMDGFCDGMDAMEVYTRLDRIRKIRDGEIVTITVDTELEDVVEIFARLNSRGTRVREADIYLGIVAARAPGWVRKEFLPYLEELTDAGFEINPNLLFRSITAIGTSKVRFKSVPDEFWNGDRIEPAWERTKKAWARLIKAFREFGISGNALLPADNAIVTALALIDRFPNEPFARILYWFLQASRFGRYSQSAETAMDEDLRDVERASSLKSAIETLLSHLRYVPPIAGHDFLKDYVDARFGRLLLYLLVYKNEAKDWDERNTRIGFENEVVLAGFQPQWHHVFPRKYLEGQVPEGDIDRLSNIAVIGPTINIRISAKQPMDYIPRYGISEEKLGQQFISSDLKDRRAADFDAWSKARAELLAKESNAFLECLRGADLQLPKVISEQPTDERAYESN